MRSTPTGVEDGGYCCEREFLNEHPVQRPIRTGPKGIGDLPKMRAGPSTKDQPGYGIMPQGLFLLDLPVFGGRQSRKISIARQIIFAAPPLGRDHIIARDIPREMQGLDDIGFRPTCLPA